MFLINFCATLHCVPHDVHLHKFTCVYKFCGNKLHDVACVDFNVLFEPDESSLGAAPKHNAAAVDLGAHKRRPKLALLGIADRELGIGRK